MPTFKLLKKVSLSNGTSHYETVRTGLSEEEAFNLAGASSGENNFTGEEDLIVEQEEEL